MKPDRKIVIEEWKNCSSQSEWGLRLKSFIFLRFSVFFKTRISRRRNKVHQELEHDIALVPAEISSDRRDDQFCELRCDAYT